MKLFSLILMTFFLTKSCTTVSKVAPQNPVFEYTANTRGFYQNIIIQDKVMTVSTDRSGEAKPETTTISDENWQFLLSEYKKINLDEMPHFKAPTEKRKFDGAAIAHFKITIADKTYQSDSFDHGFPPEEMAGLIQKIVSFTQQDDEN